MPLVPDEVSAREDAVGSIALLGDVGDVDEFSERR
jgi:hypothetical protein